MIMLIEQVRRWGLEDSRCTYRWIWHAAPWVGAAVRGTIAGGEAARGAHEAPARLHLVRGVHGATPPRIVLQLQHLGR